MKKIILSLLVVLLTTTMVFGQARSKKGANSKANKVEFVSEEEIARQEREIKNLFDQINQVDTDAKKVKLFNQIRRKMATLLDQADDFEYAFPTLDNVGKVKSSDNKVHMYTCNILLSDGTPIYMALFQHYDFAGIYSLTQKLSTGKTILPSNSGYLKEEQWYGALYYEIHPIVYKEKDVYMVFGLLPSSNGETQYKVIDVLAFSKKAIKMGAPSFIAPWAGKKKRHRVIFEYDKNAELTLTYNPKKKTIVFDHLAPIRKTADGKKDVMGPDMSYDALVYKDDVWTYKADVNVKNKKEKKSKK